MSGLVESATAILSCSERRLEITAHNVANISTPGYKRNIAFSQLVSLPAARDVLTPEIATTFNLSEGKLNPTGNPLDLAISGTGFFQLRAGDAMLYSREGQFRLAADGRALSPQGYALQQQGGGDLVLENAAVTIQQDGTVLDDGRPVGRIALTAPGDASKLRAVGETAFAVDGGPVEPVEGMIRQGMVETSNVSLGDEMVAMTATMRQSEAGARLVQVYDDLMGRVITSLGQSR